MTTGMDDVLPKWAVELTKQVAILNAKIPTHVEWVERNIKDHETRIRHQEALDVEALKSQVKTIDADVRKLRSDAEKSSWVPRIMSHAATAGLVALITVVVSMTINHQ